MHTSPAETETVAAARTLVQWARAYQAGWRPDTQAWRLADCDVEGSDYVPPDSTKQGRPDALDETDGTDFFGGLGNRYHTLDGHLAPVEDDFCDPPVATRNQLSDAWREDFEEPAPVPAIASVPVAPVEPVVPPASALAAPLPPAAIEPPASIPVARNVAVSPKASEAAPQADEHAGSASLGQCLFAPRPAGRRNLTQWVRIWNGQFSRRRSASWVWVGASAAAVVIMLTVAAAVLLMRNIAAAPPEPTTGLMSLESSPAGATAFIDGVEVGQTPLVKEVSVGSHIVEFRRGKNARTLQLTVAGGTRVTGLVDWNKKPTGRLVIESSASDTAVLVDRKKRGMAPLTLDDLSVGRHTVTLQSSLGSLSRTVTVAEGKTVTVSEELAPGLLRVTAPPGLRVFEGRDIIPLNDQRQALLPSGTHTFRFVDNVTGASERRTVTIEPNAITEVSVAPTVVASAPDTPSPPKAGTGEGP